MNQNQKTTAARELGVHRLTALRHSALKLALFEHHAKLRPDSSRIARIVIRFGVARQFEFYASRPELWF